MQEQQLKEKLGLQSFDVSTPPPEDSNPVPPATPPPHIVTASNQQGRKASSTSDNLESDSSITPGMSYKKLVKFTRNNFMNYGMR